MSSLDEKVVKEMWEGSIPVVFNLAINEVTAMESPVSICLMLPRLSYLPLVTTEVRSHFLSSAPAREDEMWFEADGTPLKWNIPIGVLFDLHSNKTDTLPWQLTVHFQGFPSQKLLRLKAISTVRSFYFNSLKEGCFLRTGSSKALVNIQQSELAKLWDSIIQNKHSNFLSIRNTILQTERMDLVPIRIYVRGFDDDYDFKCIQPAIKPDYDNSGKANQSLTLESCLKSSIPYLMNDPDTGEKTKMTVVIQGISPPLHSPLLWLCENLCHPDQFLYIVVTKVNTNSALSIAN